MSTATATKPKKKPAAAPAAKPEVRMVRIDLIKVDYTTQLREKRLDEETVLDYRRKYEDGVNMPPIPVFFDGEVYNPGGGHHRYEAQRLNGAELVECEVWPGTKRDALFFAARANSDNGLQRRPGDLRKAVTTLLSDPEWSKMSDGDIARHVVCARSYVSTLRTKLVTVTSSGEPASAERTYTRAGKTVTMNTSNIAAANAARATKPEAPSAPPATDPAPQLPFDGLDTLVQMGGKRPDARASDSVTAVHGDEIHGPLTDRQKAATALHAANEQWANEIRETFNAAVVAEGDGRSVYRLTGVLLLSLGDVGEAVKRLQGMDFEACEKLVSSKKLNKIIAQADGNGPGLASLARMLVKPGAVESLGILQSPAAAPLLSLLMANWGLKTPPRPSPDTAPAAPVHGKEEGLEGLKDTGSDRSLSGRFTRSPIGTSPATNVDAGEDEEAAGADGGDDQNSKQGRKSTEAREAAIDEAIRHCTHSFQDSEKRWQKLREAGATDEQLRSRIKDEIGTGGSSSSTHDYEMRAGQFTITVRKPVSAKISGKELLKRVRRVLSIPQPFAVDSGEIPEKPDGQSLSWYQWANLVLSSCGTLGHKVTKILPLGLPVELYRQGLKPKQAAKRIVDAAVMPPTEVPDDADQLPMFDGGKPAEKIDDNIIRIDQLGGAVRADQLEKSLKACDFRPSHRTNWKAPGTARIGYPIMIYQVDYVAVIAHVNNDGTDYELHPLSLAGDGPGKTWDQLRKECKLACGPEQVPLKGLVVTTPSGERLVMGSDDQRLIIRVPREAKPADDFDDNNPPIFTADAIDLTLDAIEKADAAEAIAKCTKVFASVRSLEFDQDNWVVLGQKMVRGRQCWRLCRLDPSDKDDIGHSRANAAAEAGDFHGIGVIDLTQGKRCRRKINATELLNPAAVIYVRTDKEAE